MRNACILVILLLFACALSAQDEPQKVVVLGVDALDARLTQQYMDEGRLPNFKKLADRGHYSPLETSYPPMSPAAWSTMTTGLNPGKTGIFGFIKRKEGSYEPELSLARPNEQPFAGGNPWLRLVYAFGAGIALIVVALLIGRVMTLSKDGRKQVQQLLPAMIGIGMILLSPVGGSPDRSMALFGLGGLALGALLFGYFGARNGLKIYHWVFPWLAVVFGVFYFLHNLPETLPQPETSRSGTTFWKLADDHGLRSRVIGAPVSWPAAEEYSASKMTTGLATPDAMGTFHTYTLFTEPHHEQAGGLTEMSGRIERLEFTDDVAEAALLGPPARFDRDRWKRWEEGELNRLPREEIPFTVRRTADGGVTLTLPVDAVAEEPSITLLPGEWKRHIRVYFDIGGFARLHGTVSFKLLAGGRQVRLYATPVMFDPLEQQEAFAISSPIDFAPWLVEQFGMFQTLGWAEATSALQDGVIDDATFLETCDFSFDEKREQVLGLLDRHAEWDLLAVFTYEVDRVCHMMWRHMDGNHPNHEPHAPEAYRNAIRDWYIKYDKLVGEVLDKLPSNTLLLVCSDHGFLPFYRAVNLNRWLRDNGYLVLKGETGAPTMEQLFNTESGYYEPYDWSKTRAYALGLSKIYINVRGREPEGIVEPDDVAALKDEIIRKLEALRDTDRGNTPVISGVWKREDIWEGSRLEEAGDLQIGYAAGYRVSWQTSLGGADEPLIFDNLRNWSGDHCSFDPKLVPGVIFSNRKLDASRFGLIDVGLTAINHLGVPMPELGPKDGHPWTVK
ncbi:MAG: alkaline phosphatase family protein [Planctomycetes bacterium]|nr:alkaline phosphatase family protein [Planctomycetota bacterium]